MTVRRLISGVCLTALAMIGCERVIEPLPAPGGSATARPSVRPTLVVPSAVLDSAGQLDFWTGFAFFRDPWIPSPATTTARDGLGPLFNAHSCVSCHASGGRGRSLLQDPNALSTVLKTGVKGKAGQVPHPEIGRQLQTQAIYPHRGVDSVREFGPFYAGEGRIELRIESHDIEFDDGDRPTLSRPVFEIVGRGAEVELLTSARIAPALVGMGLLEVIPVSGLEALQDPDDDNGDGISGRIHWRQVDGNDNTVPGRFGWKAIHSSVAEQTAAAFIEDIGITNPLHPQQNCTAHQSQCQAQIHGTDPDEGVEITAGLFKRVVHFAANVAPPAPAGPSSAIARGRSIFRRVGCADCHTPSHIVEVVHADGNLRNETIWPYTDLLLHDMGEGLADGLGEGDASGAEWRTPPLWGLGRSLELNKATGLLHDGRALNLAEAILWHGGEGREARDRYLKLEADERMSLEAFVLAL